MDHCETCADWKWKEKIRSRLADGLSKKLRTSNEVSMLQYSTQIYGYTTVMNTDGTGDSQGS